MENILYLLNGISNLIIAIIALSFIRFHKEKRIHRITKWIIVLGFPYLIISILNVAWFFSLLKYSVKDLTIIKSIFTVFETLIFSAAVYSLIQNKNLFYLLYVYTISLLIVVISFFYIPLSLAVVSYLLILVLFLNFVAPKSIYGRIGYLGILYVAISIIFITIAILNLERVILFWFIPNIVMILFLLAFSKDIEKYPLISKDMIQYKKPSLVLSFIKYFVFIITIANLLLISTVGIHEIGHALVAQIYKCEYIRAVIYEPNSSPYTEIICNYVGSQKAVVLGGLGLTILTALLLFFVGTKMIKDFSYLIFGFALLISFDDLKILKFSDNLIAVIIVLGVVMLIWAVIKLAITHIEQHEFFTPIHLP